MYQRLNMTKPADFFTPLPQRATAGVYACRMVQFNKDMDRLLRQYLREARTYGSIVIGHLQNPDEKQLSYYNEIMGMQFQLDASFLNQALAKWLPRLNSVARKSVVEAMAATLQEMQRQGKNDNMLKNAYIKFMCWMYYRLESVLRYLGAERIPKILYEGTPSRYELSMLHILTQAGCDLLFVETQGDTEYQKLDAQNQYSQPLPIVEGKSFPAGFSILAIQKEEQKQAQFRALYKEEEVRICATNTWIKGDILKDSRMLCAQRGEKDYIYNLFARITGVEDKTTFGLDWMNWKLALEGQGRKVIVWEEIQPPTPNEIAVVNKNNYNNTMQLFQDMVSKVHIKNNSALESQVRSAFLELLQEEEKKEEGNLNRLKNRAIYLLCWLQRYQAVLFEGWQQGRDYNTLLYWGICKDAYEVLFLRLLSRLPLDIILLNPDRTKQCKLQDEHLYEQNFEGAMSMQHFPSNAQQAAFGTAAYHAEQELNDTLYQDSGIYRSHQYQKARVISLQTMYEEMYLLWDQEVKFRPNFEIVDDVVILPVMFEKINGVKDRDLHNYWQETARLLVDDTLFLKNMGELEQLVHIQTQYPISFLKNKKLQRTEIRKHPSYPYAIFREETQEYMLDKLQELLDSGWIKGTYEFGVEYKIIATVLSLDMQVTRLIQTLDFTKKVPKLVLYATNEQIISLEGSILLAYLHLIGFDIAVFVPTGYQVIEAHFTTPIYLEQQIGDFLYDLSVPQLMHGSTGSYRSQKRESFFDKLFRKGW